MFNSFSDYFGKSKTNLYFYNMKKLFFIFTLLFCFVIKAQIHNRLLKINFGISAEQFRISDNIKSFNDTSAMNSFNHKLTLPMVSISEEFTLNELFSLSGTLGYQYFDIDYNNQKYGTNLFFASVNPQLSVFYRAGFEYYLKLKVGVVYRQGNLESIPIYTQRFFPNKINVFTGVTIAGINVFFHDNWGANMELSLWSPELINVGLTYRFFKGELPENMPENGYYND